MANNSKKRGKNKSVINYAERAAFVRQFDKLNTKNRKNFTRGEKAAISRKFNKLQKINSERTKFKIIKSKKELNNLKNQGAIVTKKGVFILRPLDGDGKPIPGVKTYINKNGVITFSKGSRHEYIIYLTPDERKLVAVDFEKLLPELIKKNRGIQRRINAGEKYNLQLVFGNYNGVNQYGDAGLLSQYLADMNPESFKSLVAIRFIFY